MGYAMPVKAAMPLGLLASNQLHIPLWLLGQITHCLILVRWLIPWETLPMKTLGRNSTRVLLQTLINCNLRLPSKDKPLH